ncbi:hypothetical protein [Microbacterium sp. H1-D42]|uniref:hypothetical protein n=1 Tax=Microbacterium sp. H1-D42 TaxID=2925844 RepID=UPI001F530B6D|nr:hypothetical protein [Microbacterium sp. H1-D42]UNK69869.1 hypothetical protein MNR00_11900 [Microbacterium sp. H1-D42]
MSAEQIAFQITYASVDSGGGDDPTSAAERILRDERVLAAVRGFDGDETVLLIPVTDSGDVVALDADGRLRFDLTAQHLLELFDAEGLTLHLGFVDDALEAVDAELDEQFSEAFEQLDDSAASPEDLAGFGMPDGDAELDEDLFAVDPVQVAEFSRRGPWGARLTAQILQTSVDYLEVGTWSLYGYRTDRPHMAVSGGSADGPIIEVNLPAHGDAWVEITSPRGRTAMIWPNSEQHTRPVLEIDAMTVPESAEVYRRMLTEADGTGEELAGLDMGDAIDIAAAQRACLPEVLGGVVGETARIEAFIAAFGVPATLISAGLDDRASGRRFTPRGWGRTAGDFLLGGLVETTSLTRRGRPLDRFARFLRKRPLLGASISTAELATGIAFSRSRSRIGRGVGILLIIDAVADLVIWTVRMLRR